MCIINCLQNPEMQCIYVLYDIADITFDEHTLL